MLHECGKLYFFATIILQSMSVKRTMVAVSILVWIQSILLSVAVMLDIPCTVMATAVKVCTFSIDPPCLFLLPILPLHICPQMLMNVLRITTVKVLA